MTDVVPESAEAVMAQRDAIAEAMGGETDPDRWSQLFAARQALCWAANPAGYASPLETVQGGKCWGPLHVGGQAQDENGAG